MWSLNLVRKKYSYWKEFSERDIKIAGGEKKKANTCNTNELVLEKKIQENKWEKYANENEILLEAKLNLLDMQKIFDAQLETYILRFK